MIILIIISIPTGFTFESGFNKIKQLDTEYNTDFKTEVINGQKIDYDNILPYLTDLKILREKVYGSIDEFPTDEESALLLFIDARTLMLLSEKNYIIGSQYGDKGLSSDKEGFACSEAGYLINTAYYYNLSYSAGLESSLKFDNLLNDYRDITDIWNLVGINKQKPKFLAYPLGDLKLDVEKNLIALRDYCSINMANGLRVVNPQDYAQGPVNPLPSKGNKSIANSADEFKKVFGEQGLNINYTTSKG